MPRRVLRQCLLLELYLLCVAGLVRMSPFSMLLLHVPLDYIMAGRISGVHCPFGVRVCLSLGVSARFVPDRVARSEANPLRDGAVLLLELGQLLLGPEGLVAL